MATSMIEHGSATRRGIWRRMTRTPLSTAATVTVLLIVVLAVLAPVLWADAATDPQPDRLSQLPSAGHLLGTDALGRDLLARTAVATRLSILLALAATVFGQLLGLVLGALPVLLAGRAGRFFTSAVNLAVAFPGLLLAIFFAVIFGVGQVGAVLALGAASVPWFARIVQTLAASVAGRDYLSAAHMLGVGRVRSFLRHVLPNIAEPLVVNMTQAASALLLSFAGLSFLGIGVQPPQYDWGRLMLEGLQSIYINPAGALGPGAALVIAALAFNLAGEAGAQVLRSAGGTARHRRRHHRDARGVTASSDFVLRVRNLRVEVMTPDGPITPVRGVDFDIRPNESVGIVGESGSGKSLTALGIARLLQSPAHVSADELTLDGIDISIGSDSQLRRRIGDRIAFVFQDPMSAMNPVIRVGTQLAEVSQRHGGLSWRSAHARAVEVLRTVRIAAPERRVREYPHELSGGMRQRAVIGMGLMSSPRLIIADEPTTALDVTVQRDVLRLLGHTRQELGAALLMISHDIAVVSAVCDRVLVMYAGKIIEDLPVHELNSIPQHPYTRALLAAIPTMTTPLDRPIATIPGRPPEPRHFPQGCAFVDRCPFAGDICRRQDPALTPDDSGQHRVACWFPQEGPIDGDIARGCDAGDS